MRMRAADRHRAPAAARRVRGARPLPADRDRGGAARGGPLGAVAGWYWCGAGGGLLALALHEETGLPLVAMLSALQTADDDLPLELVLEAGVGCDAHMLCGCGWRAVGRL